MGSVFKCLGQVDKKKAEKIAKHNQKLPMDEWDEPKLVDYVITEQSLKEGFEKVFGARCDIFATLLYIRGSGRLDYYHINLMEFYDLFRLLLVSCQFNYFVRTKTKS
jgi:hypothetical protein